MIINQDSNSGSITSAPSSNTISYESNSTQTKTNVNDDMLGYVKKMHWLDQDPNSTYTSDMASASSLNAQPAITSISASNTSTFTISTNIFNSYFPLSNKPFKSSIKPPWRTTKGRSFLQDYIKSDQKVTSKKKVSWSSNEPQFIESVSIVEEEDDEKGVNDENYDSRTDQPANEEVHESESNDVEMSTSDLDASSTLLTLSNTTIPNITASNTPTSDLINSSTSNATFSLGTVFQSRHGARMAIYLYSHLESQQCSVITCAKSEANHVSNEIIGCSNRNLSTSSYGRREKCPFLIELTPVDQKKPNGNYKIVKFVDHHNHGKVNVGFWKSPNAPRLLPEYENDSEEFNLETSSTKKDNNYEERRKVVESIREEPVEEMNNVNIEDVIEKKRSLSASFSPPRKVIKKSKKVRKVISNTEISRTSQLETPSRPLTLNEVDSFLIAFDESLTLSSEVLYNSGIHSLQSLVNFLAMGKEIKKHFLNALKVEKDQKKKLLKIGR